MEGETLLFLGVILAGFYLAWTIGANDVANAMGTSVGSSALTLKQAVIIAAILEFSGAFFFGSHVTETVQKGIINPDIFTNIPLEYALGMLASLIGVGIWLQIATYFGWPVSTTHAIVGALVGFGAIVGGMQAIYWDSVVFIVSSWILSPLMGGLLGFFIFTWLRQTILYRSHPVREAKKAMPYLVFSVIFVLCLLFLYNGLSNLNLSLNITEALIISLLLSLLAAIITYFAVKRIVVPAPHHSSQIYAPEMFMALEKARRQLIQVRHQAPLEINSRVESILDEITSMKEMMSHPEEYAVASQEFRIIEKMFGYLQILSASLMAFAHGANDVANAIGPLSAALDVLKTHSISLLAPVPVWTLALGGFGIVIGLATWGWRVIETIGKKLTELTPTRGFSAEFGAAFTILIASRLGMPISTTHTLVGAVVGVGLARGLEALNLSTMRDIILSWIITIPAGALLTIGVFYTLKAFIT